MQRRWERYPVDLTVQVFADGHEHRVAVADLSRGGAFVKLAPPLPMGEPVAIAMFFEGRQLATSARVVRAVETGTALAFEAPTHHADALFLRAVDRLLAKRIVGTPATGAPVAVPAERVILRGDLAELGLAAILVMLEQEKKTGKLVLRDAGANTAWIELANGAIAAAGSSTMSGELRAVVMAVLDWRTGELELFAAPPVAVATGKLPVTWALMEHARICDERASRRHVA